MEQYIANTIRRIVGIRIGLDWFIILRSQKLIRRSIDIIVVFIDAKFIFSICLIGLLEQFGKSPPRQPRQCTI